jgi:2-C-methyl-D-erythritol 4-phosphate cytidylyltransferase
MQTEVPKQFLPVAGQPILMHTLAVFHRCSPAISLILVLPEADRSRWQTLCADYQFTVSHTVVAGGATRSASVFNGLQAVADAPPSLVAVHDGVRPLVSPGLINRSYEAAEQHGSAVASVPLKDSIRVVDEKGSRAVNRTTYRLVQTPQTFRTEWLRDGYAGADGRTFSDDASLVEHSGRSIYLIEGDYRNLKITTPEDLTVAQALLKK